MQLNIIDYPSHLYTNESKGTDWSKKGYRCIWTWETIQHYTETQIKVKEQLVVRKDIDVNKHERLSSITLRHKLR
jgi:lipoate-protein ligase B